VTISDEQVDQLLESLDRGRQAWITGVVGAGQGGLDALQDDDMTIFGPWGGDVGRGPGLPDRQRAVASLFHGGVGHIEVVKTIIEGDLVILVLIERNEVEVEGVDGPQPWILRTTQVFDRRDGVWVRLHRHADPLIDRRSPDDTFALARGNPR
jgi:hypothetical protein